MSWYADVDDGDEVMSAREKRAITDRLDMLEEEAEAFASKFADLLRDVEALKKARAAK